MRNVVHMSRSSQLNLANNEIGDMGTAELAKALTSNNTLTGVC